MTMLESRGDLELVRLVPASAELPSMGQPTISAEQRLRNLYARVRRFEASMGPPTISADQGYPTEPAPGAAFRAKIANLCVARLAHAFQLPSSYP
ncbi:hypothetical protein, partial [Alicyclobacillus acidocaldarius]|uniref:hypothetical protein n=1 Tax=Alicyclobacillus acidocaldarius TaxID=405212 RepID=UPI00345ECA52